MPGVDVAITALRGLLAAAALVLLGTAPPDGRRSASRRLAWAALALLAFSANYNFFAWTGFHRHELFHYYLGAKYFPELGYDGLYRCSLAAALPDLGPSPDLSFPVTDLPGRERRPAAELLPRAPRCDGAFAPARWARFEADVRAFREILGERGFRGVLFDHGYNPTPVWTAVGRPIASRVEPTPESLWWIARLDRLLLLLAFAGVGWAFGFEAMCLAAVAWGVNPLARYSWIGDAFLRQEWFCSAILALCALRRRRQVAAGALLALSALLRVFPVFFFVGWACHALARAWRERRLAPETWRFALAAGLAGALLLAAGTAASGRGPAVHREFAHHIRQYTELVPLNGFGLEYVLRIGTQWRAARDPTPEILRMQPEERREALFRPVRPLYWLLAAAALALLGRAAWRAEAWEATAAGFALIPILAMPAGYYTGFVVAGALLATRRPRIGIALLATLIGWCWAVATYGDERPAFVVSSLFGLAFSFYALVELARPAAPVPRP